MVGDKLRIPLWLYWAVVLAGISDFNTEELEALLCYRMMLNS